MSKILRYSTSLVTALLLCGCALGDDTKLGRENSSSIGRTSAALSIVQKSTNSSFSAVSSLESIPNQGLKFQKAKSLSDEHISNQDVEEILNQGDALLSEKRWSEAKKTFEKGLKVYPDNDLLRLQFTKARRRQEINVRYQDAAFSTLTKEVALEDLMRVFDEVFLDVDVYYVDSPDYKELYKSGLAGVREALTEDAFYEQNGAQLSSKVKIERFFDKLRLASFENDLRTKDDARAAIVHLAKQMERQTGIRATAIISEFLCSMICSLDAYSSSMTPIQVEDVFALIDGCFVGIGVELKSDDPTRIARIINGSPAQERGVRVGDEIVAIDERFTKGLTAAEIGSLLQGQEGDKVVLRLRSSNDSQERRVSITRRPIDVPSVENIHVLDTDNKIGYVKITCFQKTTGKELVDAIEYLDKRGMKKLIVDLRQNPGGLLQEAIETSNIFLQSGLIVKTRGRNSEQRFEAQHSPVCSVPLVVLVDSNSASAAEIFAGAIQENKRGLIVGTQSFGKGTVQAIVQLKCKTTTVKPIAGLRITTEKFYSPQGRSYSGVGVLPDVEVSLEQDDRATHCYVSDNDSNSTSYKPSNNKAVGGYEKAQVSEEYSDEVIGDPVLDRAIQEISKIVLIN